MHSAKRHSVPAVSRALPLLALSTAAIVLLAGCGRADTPNETGGPVSDGPATGTLNIWAGSGEGDVLQAFADTFEVENPDVSVEITVVPQDDMDINLQAAITAGTTPDLTFLYTEGMQSWLATDAFLPVPDGLIDDTIFFPATVENGSIDGTLYTIPWYASTYTLLYRKDIAAAAGVEAPTTWDEYVPFLEALKEQGVDFPTIASTRWNSFTADELRIIVASNGCSLLSDDQAEWALNSDCVVDAAAFWGELFAAELVSTDGPAFLDQAAAFADGALGAYIIGPFAVSWIREASSGEFIEESLGATLVPAGSAGSVSRLSGASWAVFADGQNPDAAWKFAQFMTDVDRQVELYEAFGSPPAIVAAWDEPALDTPELAVQAEQLQSLVLAPQVASWNEVANVIGQQMERVARGLATAQEAMDAAQLEAESIGFGD